MRFSDCVDYASPPTSYDMTMREERRRQLWYHPAELSLIQKEARSLGDSVRQQHQKIQLLNPISYTNVIQRTYQACVKGGVPTGEDIRNLAYWFRTCPTRRGLERAFVPDVTRDRLRRIEYGMDAVFAIQEQLNQTKNLSYDERAEMLRKASMLVSCSSAVYARVQGMADAMSVADDRSSSIPPPSDEQESDGDFQRHAGKKRRVGKMASVVTSNQRETLQVRRKNVAWRSQLSQPVGSTDVSPVVVA